MTEGRTCHKCNKAIDDASFDLGEAFEVRAAYPPGSVTYVHRKCPEGVSRPEQDSDAPVGGVEDSS